MDSTLGSDQAVLVDLTAKTPTSLSQRRILEAARKRFEASGYRRSTIADIARDAGVAVGTVYRYFDSKEEVFVAVIQQVNAGWLERAREALTKPGRPLERLLRLVQMSLEFTRENALLDAILRGDTDMILAPLLQPLEEYMLKQNVEMIAEVVRDAIEAGELRETDPEKTAAIWFYMGTALFNQRDYPMEELMPTFIEMLLNGVLPRPEPR